MQNTPPNPWQARLDLGFENRAGKTVLARRSQCGPLTVQRAFYPEEGLAHLYLLHPPGGVVGGDALAVRAECASQAQVLLTTPAAGKFYRSDGALARQSVNLKIADGASLEWLPQETILFGGALAELDLTVELAGRAGFIGWDMLCLGRPASGDGYAQGSARLRLRVERDGLPLLAESLPADRAFMQAAWGLRGNPVFGTLLAHPFPPADLAALQALWEDKPQFAATWLDGLLVCRGMAAEAAELKAEFERAWALARPLCLHRPACPPRIWAT